MPDSRILLHDAPLKNNIVCRYNLRAQNARSLDRSPLLLQDLHCPYCPMTFIYHSHSLSFIFCTSETVYRPKRTQSRCRVCIWCLVHNLLQFSEMGVEITHIVQQPLMAQRGLLLRHNLLDLRHCLLVDIPSVFCEPEQLAWIGGVILGT